MDDCDWSADGGVSNAPGPGQNTCANCGSTNLEEDTVHALVACQDCGVAVQGQFIENYHPPSYSQSSGERSREQIRVFSAKDYATKKVGRLIERTKKMAAATKLSKAQTDICIEQAKELNRRGVIGRKFKIDQVAAVLIFTSWKRDNPAVSASDMWTPTGIKPHALLRTTKLLSEEHPDLISETQSVTDEERLIRRLERFPTPLSTEERKRVLTVAQDIWSLVVNIKVQDSPIRRRIPINDYSILIVAVENVKRQKFPKPDLAILAEKLTMTAQSVHSRVWKIKTALVSLAALSPLLEQDVKRKVITTQNIVRYLDTLILNKEYLVTEMESLEGDSEREESCLPETEKKKRKRPKRTRRKSPPGPKVLASGDVLPCGEDEEEGGNLSDLDGDIDEYILDEKEVEVREQFLKQTMQ